MKCIFVRVAGCDFKCSWCDSKFAWAVDKSTETFTETDLAAELLDRCLSNKVNHVIITGGNPCLYNFDNVIDILHENSIKVDIETQGSILPDWLYKVDQLVISPKAPSSGQPDVYDKVSRFLHNELKMPLNYKVAIKIPIFTDEDFEFAKRYYSLVQLIQYGFSIDCRLYLNVGNTNTEETGDISNRILLNYKDLIEKVCNSEFEDVYIMPQIHTLVWGNRQGV